MLRKKVTREEDQIPHLQNFTPNMMDSEDTALLIGKRKSGKTTALIDIMYHKRRVPDGLVFCGTADSNDAFQRIVPDSFIYHGWDNSAILRAIKRQQDVNAARQSQGLPKKYSFLISDDNGWDSAFCKDKQLLRLLMNGRWWGFAPFLVTLQFPLGFSPAYRNQFDWIFLFRELLPSNRKRLYEHYAGQIGSYRRFCNTLDHYTSDYSCLVVRNSGNSNKLKDNFFVWKAKIRDWEINPNQKRWHMGSRSYWKSHFQNYDPKWRKRGDEEDDDE